MCPTFRSGSTYSLIFLYIVFIIFFTLTSFSCSFSLSTHSHYITSKFTLPPAPPHQTISTPPWRFWCPLLSSCSQVHLAARRDHWDQVCHPEGQQEDRNIQMACETSWRCHVHQLCHPVEVLCRWAGCNSSNSSINSTLVTVAASVVTASVPGITASVIIVLIVIVVAVAVVILGGGRGIHKKKRLVYFHGFFDK